MTIRGSSARERAQADPGVPLISVVIPAYNAEATVLETIESVRAQTFSAFELIVIDDGSTDGTPRRLGTIHDTRLRIFRYPNAGLAVARNRGLQKSRGEFVSFIDADDLWTPDKLELQLEALRRRPAAALAYSWTAFVDAMGGFLFAKEPFSREGDVFADLLRENFIASGSNILVRRACAVAVGCFDTTLHAAHDWNFCLQVAARWPFALVPRYQILYRISEDAMSANAERAEQERLVITDRAFSAPARRRLPRREQSHATVKQYAVFLYLTRAGGLDFPARARRKLVESIRLHPRTLLTRKTWCLLLAWLPLPWLPTRLRRPAVMLLLRSYGRCSAIWRPAVRALLSRLPARAEAELKRPLGGTAGPQPVGHAGGVLRIRPTAKNT
jgi:glycosyltransferase involved in cell wall biosynthesis